MDNTPKTKTKKPDYPVIVLWLFLGWFGAHRFYMKKHVSAMLMFITTGATFFFLYDIIVYGIVYILFAVFGGGIVILLYTIPSLFIGLLFKGLIFIVVWWIIDLFFVIKFSRNKTIQNSDPEPTSTH